MIKDFAAIRAAIDLFMTRLDALGKCGGDLVAIEDTLQSSIAPLARDLGWRRTIRCKLVPLDLPEISAAWPREQHTRTSAFKFTSCGDVELLINKSMIEMGRHSHISCLAVYVWLFGAAIERFPALRGEYTCVLVLLRHNDG